MAKIAILNDTHLGIRNSSDIFLDNAAKFYKEVFFPVCDEYKIKQVLHLGDYYDNRKTINIKALNHNRKSFLEPLRARHMMMDIIPGNHDCYYKNTNDVNSLKELLGYFMNEVNIISKPTVMNYFGTKIAMLPWINSENYDFSMSFVNNCDAKFLCGHLEFAGFDMMRGVESKHGMDTKPFEKFDLVMTGHYHTRSQQKNILYLGSQMEFTWSDAHDQKYFYVFDTETEELEQIENPYTLFEKIVYNDSIFDMQAYDFTNLDGKFVKIVVTHKANQDAFDNFITKVSDRKIHDLKIDEDLTEFKGENVEIEQVEVEDTQKLIYYYVDSTDTNLDKDRIKKLMSSLHVEAQMME